MLAVIRFWGVRSEASISRVAAGTIEIEENGQDTSFETDLDPLDELKAAR